MNAEYSPRCESEFDFHVTFGRRCKVCVVSRRIIPAVASFADQGQTSVEDVEAIVERMCSGCVIDFAAEWQEDSYQPTMLLQLWPAPFAG